MTDPRVIIVSLLALLVTGAFDTLSAPPEVTPTPTEGAAFRILDEKIDLEVDRLQRKLEDSRERFKRSMREAFETVRLDRVEAAKAVSKSQPPPKPSAPKPTQTPVLIFIPTTPTAVVPACGAGGLLAPLINGCIRK